jgi:hypothetical protein
MQFDDIMDPLAAKATKLSVEFKKLGGAQGVIDALLFGEMNAADIKESLEMIKTNWEWFEKSTAEESFQAMNKVMNDQWQITKDLNEANRERKTYDISQVDLINAQITAGKAEIQVENDKYAAMRATGADPTALNAQAIAVDKVREKVKDLNTVLTVTTGTFAGGFQQGLKKFSDSIGTTFQQAQQLAENTSNDMRDTFQSVFFDMFQGQVKSLGDYWQLFLNKMESSFATALANMMQQWIDTMLSMSMKQNSASSESYGGTGIVGMFVNTLFGGGGVADVLAALDHGGGIAGTEASSYRLVPSLAFAGAPRYHRGIGPGEQAAVLRKDEGVFTPGQMKALGFLAKGGNSQGGQASPNVNIIYAIDTKSFEDYLRRNPRPIINTVDQAIRGNSGLRNTIKQYAR